MNKREHLLILLMEECAEVQQAASKAIRFGLEDVKPTTYTTNAENICIEASQLMAVYSLLVGEGMVNPISDYEIENKYEKICKYTVISQNLGLLDK